MEYFIPTVSSKFDAMLLIIKILLNLCGQMRSALFFNLIFFSGLKEILVLKH